MKWVYDYIAKSAFKSPPGKPYLSGRLGSREVLLRLGARNNVT